MSRVDLNAIEQVVTDFLERRTGTKNIGRTVHLFESGLMNSLFVLELLAFLESRFRLKVTVDDLDLSRFSTVESVAAFVSEKQPTQHP